ncbi:MAG: hypothetical protein GF335_02315 [Candidatus Moranbacteria bacterium]|nr:hypothetical protein [Candidatus Moranbacteria bacterium]
MDKIIINQKKYSFKPGERVLDICRKNDIEIATLCDHQNFSDFYKQDKRYSGKAVCRICLIKVKRKGCEDFEILPSCVLEAQKDMEVVTEDKELARLRKTNLELLFADHAGLCSYCYKNNDCELQTLAQRHDIDEFKFTPLAREMNDQEELEMLWEKKSRRIIDNKNPAIMRDSQTCIKCRRCEKVCEFIQSVDAYAICDKGYRANAATEYNTPLECTYCGQCSSVCPTAAIVEKSAIKQFMEAVKDPKKTVIVQTAPSVRVSLGEEFGMLTGTIVTGKMVRALRECGSDVVFDTNLSADLTIMEEAAELIERIEKKEKPLPMFTSCCPAWILFLEQNYSEFLEHISTCRSPQMMMGSLIKNYYSQKSGIDPENIFSVSVMPCVCKKYEAQRPEFIKSSIGDVDCVLTTRELGKLIRQKNIDFENLQDSDFDPVLGLGSSAGAIFGATGGVMEAALRTAYYDLTKHNPENLVFKEVRGLSGMRNSKVKIGDLELRTKVVHGLGNARKVIEDMKKGDIDFDFLEVMACPGGCIGGGGQPVPTSPKIRKARTNSIYSQDETMKLRLSHENPQIKELYKNFLTQPGSRKAHKYLHTHYYPYKYKFKFK